MPNDDRFDPLAHLPALRRYARALTRDAAAADDLVQDALVRAYDKRHTFRGGRLGGWLLSIVYSTFLNNRRSRLAEQARAERLAEVSPQSAEPAQEHAVRLAQIQTAFLELPEDQRAALHLVAVEGLAYADAAAVMNVPLGTLMSRLARARATLRRVEAVRGEAASGTRLRVVGGNDD
jgi:RNA polymerase sigma-70 factor, ECF subfamily